MLAGALCGITFMKTIERSIILLTIFIIGCESTSIRKGKEQIELPTPSFSNLVETRQAYHLSNIELSGYFNYSFENVALYKTKHSGTDEAIWIDFSHNLAESLNEEILENLNGRKIKVQGNFDKNDRGHLNLFIGTIEVDFLETTK